MKGKFFRRKLLVVSSVIVGAIVVICHLIIFVNSKEANKSSVAKSKITAPVTSVDTRSCLEITGFKETTGHPEANTVTETADSKTRGSETIHDSIVTEKNSDVTTRREETAALPVSETTAVTPDITDVPLDTNAEQPYETIVLSETDNENTPIIPLPVERPTGTNYPVVSSARVDNSFFADAVFVGDSRTQGLQLYGDIKNATYYAY